MSRPSPGHVIAATHLCELCGRAALHVLAARAYVAPIDTPRAPGLAGAFQDRTLWLLSLPL